jgi:hypothetical protein
MALDHIVVQPTANARSVLFTVPAGAYGVNVTIQNRATASARDIAIGDDTLGAVSGSNAGIKIPFGTTFQMVCNAGDVIYAYTAGDFVATSEYVVVLYSTQFK